MSISPVSAGLVRRLWATAMALTVVVGGLTAATVVAAPRTRPNQQFQWSRT